MYHDPNSVFSAKFIGTPPMNTLPLPDCKVHVGFRAEKGILAREADQNAGMCLRGKITAREMLGSDTQYKVVLSNGAVMVKIPDLHFREDEEIFVNVALESMYFFDSDETRIRPESHQKYAEYVHKAGELRS